MKADGDAKSLHLGSRTMGDKRGEPEIATRLRELRGTRTIDDVVYGMRARFGDETISRSTLINYEAGKTAQRIDVLRKFADFYERSILWIIAGDDAPDGAAISRAASTVTGEPTEPADRPRRRATDRKRP